MVTTNPLPEDLHVIVRLGDDLEISLTTGQVVRYLVWRMKRFTPIYVICPVCKGARIVQVHPADRKYLFGAGIGLSCPHKDRVWTWVKIGENAHELTRHALTDALKQIFPKNDLR